VSRRQDREALEIMIDRIRSLHAVVRGRPEYLSISVSYLSGSPSYHILYFPVLVVGDRSVLLLMCQCSDNDNI
jgi:hypothetical protein